MTMRTERYEEGRESVPKDEPQPILTMKAKLQERANLATQKLDQLLRRLTDLYEEYNAQHRNQQEGKKSANGAAVTQYRIRHSKSLLFRGSEQAI